MWGYELLTVKNYFVMKCHKGMDWIDLAQDRDQWRALVNTVMNLRGSIKCWEIVQ
jgi:hypothetical protein